MIYFFGFFVACIPFIVQGYKCYAQFDLTFPTFTIVVHPISVIKNSAQCCDICANTSGCKTWLYYPLDAAAYPKGCHLKNGTGSYRNHDGAPGMVAGYHPDFVPYNSEAKNAKVDHEHVYTTGSSVGTANVPDWKSCLDVCSSVSACKYWSFSGNTCSLKSTDSGRAVDTAFISGASNNRCQRYSLQSGLMSYIPDNPMITIENVGSFEECGMECWKQYGCNALQYTDTSGICYLIKRTPSSSPALITRSSGTTNLHLYLVI